MPSVTAQCTTQALIVGAGPVGLALALDLGRRGIRSIIIERGPSTATELLAKADYLNERSMEFCRVLGIRDDVVNAGFPEDVSRDTFFLTSLNGHFLGRLAMPCSRDRQLLPGCREMHRRCPQFWFDPLLARAVVRQGMTDIQYGSAFEDCSQDSNGVQCRVRRLSSGIVESLSAEYLIACDGLSSAVREAVSIPMKGEQLGYSVSTIVEVDRLHELHPWGMAERYMFVSPHGVWSNLTSIDGRKLYRFTVVGSSAKMHLSDEDMTDLVQKAFGRLDIPFTIRRVLPWRRTQMVAATFAEGRVYLAGDASHTMSPTGGHGLNTGLGDVMDLSWILEALIKGWGGPRLASAYTSERRNVAVRNATSSAANYHNWIDRTGRERVLEDGPQAGTERSILGKKLETSLFQEFSSLGIAMGYDYACSPIIVPDGSERLPDEPSTYIQVARPGHRAPHCWLQGNVSIIDYFGNGFVLCRFGEGGLLGEAHLQQAARNVGMPLECIAVSSEEAARLYERTLCLVRPDGMVAWRGDDISQDEAMNVIDIVRGAVGTSASVQKIQGNGILA